MVIAGLQKTTLIDYPGNIACTVFLYGCNLRCFFCHNPELVVEPCGETIKFEEFFRFLKTRKKMLDGVVITGGEPCLHDDIVDFAKRIKQEGFLVKIDTNGSFPNVLKKLLDSKCVDYIAMDVKCDLNNYKEITGGFDNTEWILKSIKILETSNIAHEYRTTVIKGFHDSIMVKNIGKLLCGAKNFSIQNFKSGKTISNNLGKECEFSKKELEGFKKILKKYIENVEIKNI